MMPRISFPSPVPGLGHLNQALMGHSCQAPKAMSSRDQCRQGEPKSSAEAIVGRGPQPPAVRLNSKV
jgi:hypothetical protein